MTLSKKIFSSPLTPAKEDDDQRPPPENKPSTPRVDRNLPGGSGDIRTLADIFDSVTFGSCGRADSPAKTVNPFEFKLRGRDRQSSGGIGSCREFDLELEVSRRRASVSPGMTHGLVRRQRTEMRRADFPPFLTTLDRNGRPRFRLRKARTNGRLEIACVMVKELEIVTCRGTEGLRMGTVRTDQKEEEAEEEENQ